MPLYDWKKIRLVAVGLATAGGARRVYAIHTFYLQTVTHILQQTYNVLRGTHMIFT